MYSIYTVNNTRLPKTNRFFTTNSEIYQVLRDIDFMIKVDKSTTDQIIQLKLIKKISNIQEEIIGDFYFELKEELFDENLYPFHHLSSTVVNKKQYIMQVSLSHYKSEVSDEIEFFITHPNFTIKEPE